MINSAALLADTRKLADRLVDDLRERTESHDESRIHVQGVYSQATAAGRTQRTFEEWREDLLAQVAAGWVLGCVFVRFCEDNSLYDTPLLSGPADRRRLAGDHRAAFFADVPTADDRDWLREIFGQYAKLPGTSGIFGERNPLWQLSPGPDGAKALVELWWATDDEGLVLRHDFTDASLDTRFLGDLYQDLSEHARKQFALLQTPEFVEKFILDRTLDPAIETFGLAETRIIDPTCGSGHFLLGAFERLLERWQQTEPGTDFRELAQRALDAVNGVDINPFAVAIARFRLLVAALQASSIYRLADAPDFQINVAAGDSLLHGTRPGQMLSGAAAYSGVLDHHYPTEDAEAAERILEAHGYQAVVGNPPYITPKDPALRDAYRSMFSAVSGKYALSVPFMERFFELATATQIPNVGAVGFVGMITSNSFATRSYGRALVNEFLADSVELTHIIDSSNAKIPGHNDDGTPTVILFGRNRRPRGDSIRAVLGVRGEPADARSGDESQVWASITRLVDSPGVEDSCISVEDAVRDRFASHPWSLQGGAAPLILSRVNAAGKSNLGQAVKSMGVTAISTADEQMSCAENVALSASVEASLLAPATEGPEVRDWISSRSLVVFFPYRNRMLQDIKSFPGWLVRLWPYRTTLGNRATFSRKTYFEEGRAWWEWHQVSWERVEAERLVCFPEIATHNHFALKRSTSLMKHTVPVLAFDSSISNEDVAGIASLLNSSVWLFWARQTFYDKGTGREVWERRLQINTTDLGRFPLPTEQPSALAKALHELAETLECHLPGNATSAGVLPSRPLLDGLRATTEDGRLRMVALQEELDWTCYHLYGLTDEELTFSIDELPRLQKGERAFEIALARRMAAGDATSSWFNRHGSTPITELPGHWPDGYRQLVERRLELIGSDRAIGLLEHPEYKRRWNWAELPDLERDAQRTWLLDRLEALLSAGDPNEPEVTTVARLADQLARDDVARAVLEDLEGSQADPVKVVRQLVASAGVPYLAAMRLKESGLRIRQAWERTWALQRIEDDLDARAELPADRPDHLDASALAVARKKAGVDKIPVPPKYKSSDFRDQASWRLRGKLDVPKERFVMYPRTDLGADTSAVVGWAGWDHLQQLRALAGLYTSRKHDGAEVEELTPMLAGMLELLPWVLQWHDDPDPVFGDRMGQYFTGFLDNERAALGLTADDLTAWRP